MKDEFTIHIHEKLCRDVMQYYNEHQCVRVKEIIRNLRQQEHEADLLEDTFKRKLFHLGLDAVSVFHMVRLAETVGSIADHAENAGDMMRAMMARQHPSGNQ